MSNLRTNIIIADKLNAFRKSLEEIKGIPFFVIAAKTENQPGEIVYFLDGQILTLPEMLEVLENIIKDFQQKIK